MVGNADTRAESLQNTVCLNLFCLKTHKGHISGDLVGYKIVPKRNLRPILDIHFLKIGKALFHRKLITVGPTDFLGF